MTALSHVHMHSICPVFTYTNISFFADTWRHDDQVERCITKHARLWHPMWPPVCPPAWWGGQHQMDLRWQKLQCWVSWCAYEGKGGIVSITILVLSFIILQYNQYSLSDMSFVHVIKSLRCIEREWRCMTSYSCLPQDKESSGWAWDGWGSFSQDSLWNWLC